MLSRFSGRSERSRPLLVFFALAISNRVIAAEPTTPDSGKILTEITVVGTTPLPGTGIDVDKVPGQVQTLRSADLTREGAASVTTAINSGLSSVNIDDNLDDPFQPDILYRGFEASPVLGTPQGLAVYQNGVRINEAFGDTVNWDLFPDVAVDRIDVFGANPVYGLNALGGAVVVSMKNGFTYRGGEGEVSGGSWHQRQGSLQYGANNGTWGIYAAARLLKEDGWRVESPDSVKQLYTALSYRDNGWTLDLSFTGADNSLSGESPSPVQELAVNRSLIFTSPQSNDNRLTFTTLNATYAATDSLAFQGSLYARDFRQYVVNGNTTNYTACTTDANSGDLCQGDGTTPLTNSAGGFLPDISQGGSVAIGENDFESIRSVGVGGALQATLTAPFLGHDNYFAIGGSVDSATTQFASWVEVGTINTALAIGSSGLYVNTPENTPFTATPVDLHASNRYYGLYLTDTWSLSDALAVTASGRYNVAEVDLSDRRGTALSGDNRYSRLNPALGATYKLNARVTAYAGYSEGTRAPTAGEIECSNPTAPCLLPSSLSSDPPTLRQVVSHTWEAGLRGSTSTGSADQGHLKWNASLFRTDVHDDIYAVATSLSSGYFQNIGGTRRQGAELGARYENTRLSAFVNYSYVAATFQSTFLLPSSLNAAADANGNILVRAGDALPGIPAHRIRAGFDFRLVPSWTVGTSLVYESHQYFRGDESNQMPALAGFVVVNLHTKYQLTDRVELFANVVNLFNRQYATFGVLGDPTGVGAPGVPPGAATNDPGVDNRFESPAPPFSAFAGARVRF